MRTGIEEIVNAFFRNVNIKDYSLRNENYGICNSLKFRNLIVTSIASVAIEQWYEIDKTKRKIWFMIDSCNDKIEI